MSEPSKPEAQTVSSASPSLQAIYTAENLDAEIRQAEILSDVVQPTITNVATGEGGRVNHPLVIVAAQDCDLLNDFSARKSGGDPEMNAVLLFEVHEWEAFKTALPPGKEVKKRVRQNKDERYYYLEPVAPDLDVLSTGLPAMIVDFKRYFSLTPQELEGQLLQSARRRCRLRSPYMDHFQSRLGYFLTRVVLPDRPAIPE